MVVVGRTPPQSAQIALLIAFIGFVSHTCTLHNSNAVLLSGYRFLWISIADRQALGSRKNSANCTHEENSNSKSATQGDFFFLPFSSLANKMFNSLKKSHVRIVDTAALSNDKSFTQLFYPSFARQHRIPDYLGIYVQSCAAHTHTFVVVHVTLSLGKYTTNIESEKQQAKW